MNNNQAKQLILLAAFFIGGLIFYFLPSEIYAGNPQEFISTRPALVVSLVLIWLLFAVALILPILIPADGWRRAYAIFLGSAFLALWVSGGFLVGDFGELDGTSFNFSRHALTLFVHGLLFYVVAVTAYWCVVEWPTYAIRAINFIGAGLVVIGTFNFLSPSSATNSTLEPIDLKGLARFSKDRNLVIVVMDTFQSDVLQYLIDHDPALPDKLDGFTFYPDTLGVAPSTYLTMPAFHSGQTYNNMMTLSEYYDLGVKKGSFLVELADNGYQVDIINPITHSCPLGTNICNWQENLLLQADEVTANEASHLADLGVMRAAPGFLKKFVFQDNIGLITWLRNEVTFTGIGLLVYQGNTVLEMIADNLWTDNASPTVKFIHLFNTHPPYIFDSECNFIGAKNAQDREHMTMQVECSMTWFLYLLKQMKDSGVYENSMIILTADTGAGNAYATDSLSSLYAQKHGVEEGEFGRLIGGANPVLAIKFPSAHGSMKSSTTQAQLTDVPRTVCENLSDCTKSEGIDLRADQDLARERQYNYYQWKHEYWGLSHIPGIIQYTVTGPLWLESSWTRKLPSEMPINISAVNFSDEDDLEIFGMGWSFVEVNKAGATKRWSIAKRAELFLPLPTNKNLTLEFKVLMAPGLDEQEMTVKVNGEVVGTKELEHRVQFVSVDVPSDLVTEPVSEVILEFSNLKLPDTPNRRKISVSFYQLKIYGSEET